MSDFATEEEVGRLFDDLKFASDPQCKKCYGRGYTEKAHDGVPYVCKCVWGKIKMAECMNLGEYIEKHKKVIV